MATKNKLNFYTEPRTGGFVGKCREDITLQYDARTRTAALSGVKRLAKRLEWARLFGSLVPTRCTPTNKVTRVALVIDRSDSMRHLTKATVDLIQKNVDAFREIAAKTGVRHELMLIAFDDYVAVIRKMTDVKFFVPVAADEVSARGNTALFDAVAKAAQELKSAGLFRRAIRPSPYSQINALGDDVANLVITITDGEENMSTNYSSLTLNQLMKDLQKTDRWTFTFMLPRGEKRSFCSNFGIPDGNVSEWETTVDGLNYTSGVISSAAASYGTSRAAGQTYSSSFYTDLSGLTSKQIKQNLQDLSARVRTLDVKKEEVIKDFVERETGMPYKPGSAFYQLTKSEKNVQSYKQLLVKEKGKVSVYGGADARSVLGIPDGDLSFKPGNHGNFDIFVQSTSHNRKLVRGTKLLVMS